jgi:hypothetical protein
MTPRATDSRVTNISQIPEEESLTLEDIVEKSSVGDEVGDRESHTYDDSVIESEEYPDDGIRVIADSLITANGEVIADVMAGIRDALDKLNKVLYSKLGKH